MSAPSKGELCGALREAHAMGRRHCVSALIASVTLPHRACPLSGGGPIDVSASSAGVHVDGRVLTPAQAGELSRAIRTALLVTRSSTVRPDRGQKPLMVCRVSDDAMRVDGRVLDRAEAVKLAVALDMGAARVRAERTADIALPVVDVDLGVGVHRGYRPPGRPRSGPPPEVAALQFARTAAGLSQEELAQLLGESRARIAAWERGVVEIPQVMRRRWLAETEAQRVGP